MAVGAFLVISLFSFRLPADAAHGPVGLFEAAFEALHVPAAGIGFHRGGPACGEDRGEESLDKAQLLVGCVIHNLGIMA